MSLSPAIKAAMSAESRSLFDGKLSCDAVQAAFKANGAFSSETSFENVLDRHLIQARKAMRQLKSPWGNHKVRFSPLLLVARNVQLH